MTLCFEPYHLALMKSSDAEGVTPNTSRGSLRSALILTWKGVTVPGGRQRVDNGDALDLALATKKSTTMQEVQRDWARRARYLTQSAMPPHILGHPTNTEHPPNLELPLDGTVGILWPSAVP